MSDFICLSAKFINGYTDICQKARYGRLTGSRDGVSSRHQSRGVVLMPRVILRAEAAVMRPS